MKLPSIDKTWGADLAWYVGLVLAVGIAFGLGQGFAAGLLAAGGMLTFTALLAIGRARSDMVRVVGGAGDERNRHLYVRALAVAGGVMGLTVTGWFLVGVARGKHDPVLLTLVVLFSLTFVTSAALEARKG